MPSAYTVVAILEAKIGKETELKRELISVVKPTQAEKGCVEYRLHQDLNKPTLFFIYENWENKEAHEKHKVTPHINELSEKIGELLAVPYQLMLGQEL